LGASGRLVCFSVRAGALRRRTPRQASEPQGVFGRVLAPPLVAELFRGLGWDSGSRGGTQRGGNHASEGRPPHPRTSRNRHDRHPGRSGFRAKEGSPRRDIPACCSACTNLNRPISITAAVRIVIDAPERRGLTPRPPEGNFVPATMKPDRPGGSHPDRRDVVLQRLGEELVSKNRIRVVGALRVPAVPCVRSARQVDNSDGDPISAWDRREHHPAC
jgi:hypothetical protein